MKQFIKNNLISIILFLILLSIGLYSTSKYINWYNNYEKIVEKNIQECKDSKIEEQIISCKDIIELSNEKIKSDYFYMTNEIMRDYSKITYILFLFISLPVLYEVCKIFKNKHLLYELTRENYSNFKNKIIRNSYIKSMILPLSILIIQIIILIYCNGFTTSVYFKDSIMIDNIINPYLYFITIIIRLIIISIIYTNIALIVVRKQHDFYIASILSYLLFIGIELILEFLIGVILFDNLFKMSSMELYINIINVFNLNLEKGYMLLYLPIIIVLIITSIILYFEYRNKEKLIIDCEKNN